MAYPWSSLGSYLAAPEHRPKWIRVDRLLGEHGIRGTEPPAGRSLSERMEGAREKEMDAEALKGLRRGWCLGGKEFRKAMLEKMEGKLGENHAGELRRESAEAKGERIVREELKRLGWKESELAARRKSDPAKLAIAARLRRETTLTIKRIAQRAQLGTARSASVRLHEWMRQAKPVSASASPGLRRRSHAKRTM